MTPEIEAYLSRLNGYIEATKRLDDTFVSLRAANDELDGVMRIGIRDSGGGCPVPDADVNVNSAADLANVLRVLAKHGFRRIGEPNDCPDMMARQYSLSGGLKLWAYLTGDNCRRVRVGTQPRYEIVCA